MSGNTGHPGMTVIERVMLILSAFREDRLELRLSELSRVTGMPVSTVQRLAAELVRADVLERVDGRGGYRVARRLWEIGSLSPDLRAMREAARPYMQEIHEATGASVQLAVLQDTQVLYIERVFGPRSVSVASQVGRRLPLHATSAGKVLLAFSPDVVHEQVLRRRLKRCTPYTIVMPGRLDQALRHARENRVATCAEEMTLGTRSIAVPIRGRSGEVAAALSVVVPVNAARLHLLEHRLASAADAVSSTFQLDAARG